MRLNVPLGREYIGYPIGLGNVPRDSPTRFNAVCQNSTQLFYLNNVCVSGAVNSLAFGSFVERFALVVEKGN